MKIYPVPGRTVRDPVTHREVAGETEVNENDAFWIRRLADGDVSTEPQAEGNAGGVADGGGEQ